MIKKCYRVERNVVCTAETIIYANNEDEAKAFALDKYISDFKLKDYYLKEITDVEEI